jgi:hypothetical protein
MGNRQGHMALPTRSSSCTTDRGQSVDVVAAGDDSSNSDSGNAYYGDKFNNNNISTYPGKGI